jgi:hypothetical protein
MGLISNSNPLDFSSEACAFLNSMYYVQASGGSFSRLTTSEERVFVLQGLLNAQTEVGYSMAWPIFSPLCPGQRAYDSTEDLRPSGGSVYDWIRYSALTGYEVSEGYELEVIQKYNVTPHPRNISMTPNRKSEGATLMNSRWRVPGLLFILFTAFIVCL